MPDFTIMSSAEFEHSYPEIHAQVCSELGLGFVPNIFRCLAVANPDLALTSWQMVRQNLCHGVVPRMVKELLFSYIAYKRQCNYCYIAHHALALNYGFEHTQVNSLFDNIERLDNPTLNAVLFFADEASNASFPEPILSYRRLEKLGFETSEIVELLGMISCALYMVNIADGLSVPVDQRFIDIVNQEQA